MRPFHAAQVQTLPSGDRTGVDQAHHLRAFAPQLPACHRRQSCKGLRKNAGRAAGVGIRQCRAGQPAGAQVIVMLRIGVEAGHHGAQAVVPAQLRIDQRYQVIPALERFVVGVAVMARDDRGELPPIERFQKLFQDGRDVAHASLFSESRQPENRRGFLQTPLFCEACACDNSIHPKLSPDSPARSGRGTERG